MVEPTSVETFEPLTKSGYHDHVWAGGNERMDGIGSPASRAQSDGRVLGTWRIPRGRNSLSCNGLP